MLNSAGCRLRLDVRLDDLWAGGEVREAKFVNVFVTRISTQHCPVMQASTRLSLPLFFSLKHSDIITVLHLYQNPLWMSISSDIFAPIESVLGENNDMPAQEYQCMSWLCQNDLLYRFFPFFSLSIYMLLYEQRGLWRRVMKCWR